MSDKYEGHTPGPWEWAAGSYTRKEFLAYCAESWDNADPPADQFHVVQCDVDGENRTIAILGNGPTAHLNGPLIASAPELAAEIKRLRDELAGQYDAYMDALKSEHDTMLNTGHAKAATGTTRAMMIIGEIHDATLKVHP